MEGKMERMMYKFGQYPFFANEDGSIPSLWSPRKNYSDEKDMLLDYDATFKAGFGWKLVRVSIDGAETVLR
jgi:hypothetical protein